jgi:hypothetical protein
MSRSLYLFLTGILLFGVMQVFAQQIPFHVSDAPAPLFRDPVYDGAADPTAFYDGKKKEWLIFYTQRRARLDLKGVEFCYGTAIGLAASKDGGLSWEYRGTAILPQPDTGINTFWAPQVFRDPKDGRYHMLVTYIKGVYDDWGGTRVLMHFTSVDLKTWKPAGPIGLTGCIDASAFQLKDGTWKMWYKDESRGSFTYASVSKDLEHWTHLDSPEVRNRHHEGPIVFRWANAYWMITDPTYESYTGMDVFRSDDATHWKWNNTILDKPGMRPDDNDQGRHGDVQIVNGKAILFYFTHPGRIYLENGKKEVADEDSYRCRYSSLQVAELEFVNGKVVCDRDKYWKGRGK